MRSLAGSLFVLLLASTAAAATGNIGPYYLGNNYGNKAPSDPLYAENAFDLFYPEGACPLSPTCDNLARPVAVFIRGGNENAPLSGPNQLPPIAQKLLAQDFVVAIPSYHIVVYDIPDDDVAATKDLARMVQYLRRFRTILNIDPNRVFCFGHSGGGYHAYALGLATDYQNLASRDLVERESSRPNFIAPWGAISDFYCFDFDNPGVNPILPKILAGNPDNLYLKSPTYWFESPDVYGRTFTPPMCIVANLSMMNPCGTIWDPHDGTFGFMMWMIVQRYCGGAGMGEAVCTDSALIDTGMGTDPDAPIQAVADWMFDRAY